MKDDDDIEDTNSIWVITNNYPSLEETFINMELRLLAEEGFDLTVLNCFLHNEQGPHLTRVTVLNRVRTIGLKEWMAIFLTLLFHPNRSISVAVECMKLLALVQLPWLKMGILAFFRFIREQNHLKAGPFYCHYLSAPGVATLLCAAWSKKPFIVSAHAVDIFSARYGYLRHLLRKATRVHTCTSRNARYLRTISGVDVEVIHHGTSAKLSPPRTSLEIPGDQLKILSVGRLVEKKAHSHLLLVAKELRRLGVPFQWKMIGAGPLETLLKETARRLEVDDVVEWIGSTPHEDVLEEIRAASVFVYGSIVANDGNRDGIPNVLVEALVSGTPVLTSSISGALELKRLTGDSPLFMIAPKKVEEWAPLIVRMGRLKHDTNVSVPIEVCQQFSWRESIRKVKYNIERMTNTREAG